MAPAEAITSTAASARSVAPPRENSTPTARLPSRISLCTRAFVTISRFARFIAGRK